jgi:uncharacterized membrane protein
VQGGLGTGRVEALADGVFAVAMTLLILDVRLPPEPHARTQAEVLLALRGLWPQAVCYGMSFVTIGTLWVAHRTSIHYIRRSDRPLLWINIVLLIFVTTIPFMTSLVAQYPKYPVPVSLYGVNLLCAVAMLYWNWKTRDCTQTTGIAGTERTHSSARSNGWAECRDKKSVGTEPTARPRVSNRTMCANKPGKSPPRMIPRSPSDIAADFHRPNLLCLRDRGGLLKTVGQYRSLRAGAGFVRIPGERGQAVVEHTGPGGGQTQ